MNWEIGKLRVVYLAGRRALQKEREERGIKDITDEKKRPYINTKCMCVYVI